MVQLKLSGTRTFAGATIGHTASVAFSPEEEHIVWLWVALLQTRSPSAEGTPIGFGMSYLYPTGGKSSRAPTTWCFRH